MATAFGLDVCSDTPLLFLSGGAADPTGRPLHISVSSGDLHALGWHGSGELVCDERHADGTVIFQIEAHPEAGYLISGPDFGAHLLSRDGHEVVCAPGESHEAVWQRLLIAQVLPFAALLQGLEVFHASAVVMGASAVAFLGHSRAGKTSLALEVCNRGGRFLADDVLALEPSGEQLLAHPGTPLAGVAHEEAQRLQNLNTPADVEGAPIAENARERIVRMPSASRPVPLGTLFFLDRRHEGPSRIDFDVVTDPQMLLTATFNFVLATPERLQQLLDVCALAAQARVERIRVGPGIDAGELATAVAQRVGFDA